MPHPTALPDGPNPKAPQACHYRSALQGDALRSRSVSPLVLHHTLDIPAAPARLVADWHRETTEQLGLEPGDVEQLPLARALARWPDYRHCVQRMADWTHALGLGDLLPRSDIALMACRGARAHDDSTQYGGFAFCNLFLSEDQGLDLLFPALSVRVPLVRGTAVVFDTAQSHTVVARGRDGFQEADFTDPHCTQIFLTWELPIEEAALSRALGISVQRHPPGTAAL
jgi:hypothetical protein